MRATYDADGRPTEEFRNHVNAAIEEMWPGTMAARQRSRAMDAADPRHSDPGFGFTATDEDVRELARRMRDHLARRRKRSRARDSQPVPATQDLERLQRAAAEHLRLA